MNAARRITLKDLLIGLLYPAILGAIFYNCLPILFTREALITLRALSVLLLLFYFCIDYVYSAAFPTYRLGAFMIDLSAIVLIYRIERLLNPIGGPKTFVFAIPLLLLAVHLLFLLWDCIERANDMVAHNITAVVLLAGIAYYPNLLAFVFIQLLLCAWFFWITFTRCVSNRIPKPSNESMQQTMEG